MRLADFLLESPDYAVFNTPVGFVDLRFADAHAITFGWTRKASIYGVDIEAGIFMHMPNNIPAELGKYLYRPRQHVSHYKLPLLWVPELRKRVLGIAKNYEESLLTKLPNALSVWGGQTIADVIRNVRESEVLAKIFKVFKEADPNDQERIKQGSIFLVGNFRGRLRIPLKQDVEASPDVVDLVDPQAIYASIMKSNVGFFVESVEALEDLNENSLDRNEAFSVYGRAWIHNERLLVSFWGLPSEDGIKRTIAELLKHYPAKSVWIQTGQNSDDVWVEMKSDVKLASIEDEELDKMIKELSSKIHTATPEEKAKIRAEIARLRGGDSIGGFGSRKYAKLSDKLGFESPASLAAKRRQESFNALRVISESLLIRNELKP